MAKKILFIEDDLFLRTIIEDFLDSPDYTKFHFDLCATFNEAREKIKTTPYDLVVSDCYLTDGIVLDWLQEFKKTPVIAITATYDVDLAVRLIKAGASDLLIKDKAGKFLQLLPSKMDGVIQFTEVQRQYQVQQTFMADLFDLCSDLVHSVNADGMLTKVNPVWLKTLGYQESEIKGLTIFDVLHPEERAHCSSLLMGLKPGEVLEMVRVRFVDKQGHPHLVEGKISCAELNHQIISQGIFHPVEASNGTKNSSPSIKTNQSSDFFSIFSRLFKNTEASN